ncbi:unnamed protein product [Allacma fusca]|uniref:Uncharacterized protein n=1 Tax=Allacma fusca TaxID=39272 RepID=A0A8J2J1M2_9HEXA|nr:unnamed protein product [Allacma fusca]
MAKLDEEGFKEESLTFMSRLFLEVTEDYPSYMQARVYEKVQQALATVVGNLAGEEMNRNRAKCFAISTRKIIAASQNYLILCSTEGSNGLDLFSVFRFTHRRLPSHGEGVGVHISPTAALVRHYIVNSVH